jgi:two-component system sensor histidine kinase QseC
MISIRSKLLIILWALITVLILATGYWNYLSIRAHLFDQINTQITPEVLSALIDNIMLAQIAPLMCLWIILLILTGFSIRWSLKPLEKISEDIALRHPDYLAPLNEDEAPLEIKPMVLQLNHLFTRLSEAQIREKRFTADASHELRTPLAAAKIQAEVALVTDDAQKRQQAIEKSILGIERSAHLIQQLAILAQLKPQQALNDVTTVQLEPLAAEVIAELIPNAISKDIDIELHADVQGTPLCVPGNFAYLRVMMRNIIDNAISYSHPHEIISVQISREPDYILFRVEDHGPGIPTEEQERVFERFFRGTGHVSAGSGLGLAIVDQIVTLHKASIQLRKPQDGKEGLCFDVMFATTPTPKSRHGA